MLDFVNGGHLFFQLYRQVGACLHACLHSTKPALPSSVPCSQQIEFNSSCLAAAWMLASHGSQSMACLQGIFTEELARLYTAEIVLAISHLHSLSFVHRDLKPVRGSTDMQAWPGSGPVASRCWEVES